jgi:hypothetical protein
MARRGDPARILAAQREGLRQRLLSTGRLPERVDQLIAAWDAEAGRRALPADRRDEGAWEWIRTVDTR